jgi:RNA polymerase sigma factor (sigma-70 family)
MLQWQSFGDVRRQDDGLDLSDWTDDTTDRQDSESAAVDPQLFSEPLSPSRLSITHDLLSAEQEWALAASLDQAIAALRQCIDEQPGVLDAWMQQVTSAAADLVSTPAEAPLDELITAFDTWQVLEHLSRRHEGLAGDARLARTAVSGLILAMAPPRDTFLEMIEELIDGLPATASKRLRTCLGTVQRLRNEFVSHNIRLVHYVARRHQNRGVDLEDLVQEGILGLLKATLKFDASTGVRFSTYAYWWILQAIQNAVTQQRSLIRLPGLVSQQFHQLHAWRQRHKAETGRWPSPRETRQQLGLDEATQKDLLSLSNQCISAHTPLHTEGNRTLLDDLESDDAIRPPDEEVETLERKRCLRALLGRLSEREAKVLEMRFGLAGGQEFTLREVAASLRISPERVRQIEKEALQKLRLEGGNQGLE